jgi:hypothetical protein
MAPSNTVLVLVPVGTHDYIFVLCNFACFEMWLPLRRREQTTTSYSPSGVDAGGHVLIYWPFLSHTHLTPTDSQTAVWYGTDCVVNDASNSSYSFLYICYRGNVYTKPLRSNHREIEIWTQTLMAGIYELHLWDGLRWHDIHTKFHKNWFRHSNVDRGDTHTQTQRHKANLIRPLLVFQNKEVQLKMCPSRGH